MAAKPKQQQQQAAAGGAPDQQQQQQAAATDAPKQQQQQLWGVVGEGEPLMLMADSNGRLPLHLAAAAGALGAATALAANMVMAMVSCISLTSIFFRSFLCARGFLPEMGMAVACARVLCEGGRDVPGDGVGLLLRLAAAAAGALEAAAAVASNMVMAMVSFGTWACIVCLGGGVRVWGRGDV